MEEEWRAVDGFTDYMVSNMGKVKSLKWGKERVLKDRPDGSGYFQVVFCVEGKETSHKVHKLVAGAFIHNPTPDDKQLIDHIDRIRTNNTVSNLRWVNRSENMLNSHRHFGEMYGITLNGPASKKFKVQLNVSKKMTYLGCYKTLEEAKLARDAFVRK